MTRSKFCAVLQLFTAALMLWTYSLPAHAVVSLERSIVHDGRYINLGSISALLPGFEGTLLALDAERGRLTEFKGAAGVVYRLSGSGRAFKSENVQGLSRMADGRLLVSNADDEVISTLDASGKLLSVYATGGSAAGELSDPRGIAWSANRRLYVADRGNNRLSVFGDDGVFIHSMGHGAVPEAPALDAPVQVLVDAQERVYVLEARDQGIVSLFDHLGNLLQRFDADALGKITGVTLKIDAITIDDTGLLYIADNAAGRIYQIDWQAGKLMTAFGSKGELRGQFEIITALAVLPGDRLAVADSGNKKIDIYRLPTNRRTALEKRMLPGVGFERSVELNCSQAYRLRGGSVLCLDEASNTVTRFNASGRAETGFEAEYTDLVAAAVSDHDVVMLEAGALRIYTRAGELRYTADTAGSKPGQFDSPRGVFIRGDKIYVADTGNRRIQVFSIEGVFLTEISNPGADQPALFDQPTRVVVDANDNMYVLEQGRNQVLVFGRDQRLLYHIGSASTGVLFETLYDIAIDADNNLYILAAVPGNSASVQVYNGPTRVISFGAANEQFTGLQRPVTLSVASEARTIVSVYDKAKQALMNFNYRQLPARAGGLEISGSSRQARLSWQQVPGSYISHYKVYAARSASGPFKHITDVDADVDRPAAVITHRNAFATTHYRVSAVSGSGIEGELSSIREDVFQTGYALYREQKYSEALNVFRAAFAHEHGNGELVKYLGLSAMALHRTDDASVYFQQLSLLPGYETEGSELYVAALLALKDYDTAKAVIDRMIADSSSNAGASVDILLYCGELSLLLGDANRAINCLETALKNEPNNIRAQVDMGKAYVKLGMIDKGLEAFNIAIALDVQHAAAWYQKGVVLQALEQHEAAINSLQTALTLNADGDDALLALARSQLALQRFDEVRNIANSFAADKHTTAQAQYLLGITALAAGDNNAAVLALNRATRADETFTLAWLALADAHIRLQQHDKLRTVLENAYRGDANSFAAAQRLGMLDYTDGRYADAAQSLERAAALRPADYEALYTLADARYRSAAYRQAEIAAIKAAGLKPRAWQPLVLRADIARSQGRNDKAIEYLRQAMVLEENSALLTTHLAALYIENGMHDLARSTLQQAVLLDDTAARPQVLLAELYMQQGAYDEAIAALEKATRLDASAENRLALDAAQAAKKKSLEFKTEAPRIVLKDVKFEHVFSTAYKQYAEKPVGSFVIQNNSTRDYSNLRLTFSIDGYMDVAASLDVAVLKASSAHTVPLYAAFNERVPEIDEDTGVKTEIAVRFIRDGQNDAISISRPMTIYGKHAMLWGKPNMVASFVTPKDDSVGDFVRTAINQNKPDAAAINHKLLSAMTLFNVLGAHGIRYVVDPVSPFASVSDTRVDTVQFARETLRLKSGDSDDLSVLLCTALETMGIDTAMLVMPGHVLMMFNTGLEASQRNQVSLNDELLVIHQGYVWVPLEASMIGQRFTEAWAEAARKFREHSASGSLSVITLAQAWSEYKPLTLQPATFKLVVPQSSRVAPVVMREKDLLLEQSLDHLADPYRAIISVDPTNINARMQLASIYASNGLYAAAEREFNLLQALAPGNSAVHNNRGNMYFSQGDFERALDNYRYAEMLDPNDAGVKMNLSMAHYRQGDLKLASVKYAEASMIDAAIGKQHEDYVKLFSD